MKSKKVETIHLEHVKDKIINAKKLCEEEKNMAPMLDAINESCKYLLNSVDVDGLYKYSQKAIYGENISFSEESAIASNIYEQVHNIGSTESIFDHE